jgi:hypothetical protein
MTLLRRAPREVYRLYDEQEFFGQAAGEEPFQVAAPQAGVRWLHRVAGATVLLAVTGAVGGVVAGAGPPSVKGGGRAVRSSLLAATGSLLAARARVSQEAAGARSWARSSQAALARDVKHARALAAAVNGAREQARSLASTAAPRLPRAPVDREVLASVARNVASASAGVASASTAGVASASAGVRESQPAEFGFER